MPTYVQIITGLLVIAVVVHFVRADLADSKRARRQRQRSGHGARRASGPYSNDSGSGYYDSGSSDCGSSGGDSGGGCD